MIVVEHVEICSCGIGNCSWWTCIEQVVGFAVLVVEFHLLDLQLMDLHWTSCGICPYLPILWLRVRRMIVVEHAGINISYWVSSSKSLVDKKGFGRMVQPVNSQSTHQEWTNLKQVFSCFCFELTAWNPFSSGLPLPPKSLVDIWRMIVVEHVVICKCGICNFSWWISIEQLGRFTVLVVELHLLDLQLMDLHWTSCGIYPDLPNLWLRVRRMIVVEHAGIKISYWVSSSKSLVDKRRYWQNGQASQQIRNEPTKNKFLVNFCFVLTAWNLFPSDLPLPPKSLVDIWRMIVVEHVEVCSCGICNCKWWTCIEQVVGFAVLVMEFHLLDLQLMDLHWTSCGICPNLPNLWFRVRRMIVVEHAGVKVSFWVSSSKSLVDTKGFGRMVQPVNTSGTNQLKTSF